MSSLWLPQQQQPITAYPATGGGQLLPSPYSYVNESSAASGSYRKVFVILAVIVVLCSIACCFGRFYGRRFNKAKSLAPKKAVILPRDKESDIEFGFDHKKIRTANRPVRYGDLAGHKAALSVGGGHNGGTKKKFDYRSPAAL